MAIGLFFLVHAVDANQSELYLQVRLPATLRAYWIFGALNASLQGSSLNRFSIIFVGRDVLIYLSICLSVCLVWVKQVMIHGPINHKQHGFDVNLPISEIVDLNTDPSERCIESYMESSVWPCTVIISHTCIRIYKLHMYANILY